MIDWLADRSKVEGLIAAAIKSAVNDHGPITEENRASAAKRVYAVLREHRKQFLEEEQAPKIRGMKESTEHEDDKWMPRPQGR